MRLEPPVPMTDGRVVLRFARPEDAAPFAQAFADDAELAWRVGEEKAPDEEAARKELLEDAPRWRVEGKAVMFVIATAEDDSFHGQMVLVDIEDHHLRAEIGIWLVAGARRKGLGLRALRLLSRWAFEDLGLMRLQMKTETDNDGLLGIAGRAGFRREGVLRSYDSVQGRRSDLVLVSLLPGELSAG